MCLRQDLSHPHPEGCMRWYFIYKYAVNLMLVIGDTEILAFVLSGCLLCVDT